MRIKNLKMTQKIFLGFGIVIIIMLFVIGNSYINFSRESQAVSWNVHTYEVIQESDDILISLLNMETGVRGYAITGNSSFLEPFNQGKIAFSQHYDKLKEITSDSQNQQQRLINIKKQYDDWLNWENEEIIQGREKVSAGTIKMDELISVAQSANGKAMMDNMRSILSDINDEEEVLLQNKNVNLIKMEKETRAIMLMGALLATIMGIIIANLVVRIIVNPIKFVTNTFEEIASGQVNLEVRLNYNSNDELGEMSKNFNVFMIRLKELILENKNQNWIANGRAELNESISGDQDIAALSFNAIRYLCKYLNLQIGALYVRTDDDIFKLFGSYAYNLRKNVHTEIKNGEGILGQAVLEKQSIILTDVPKDYTKISSGTGDATPRNILICPCIYQNEVECVIELGAFKSFTQEELKFIEQISENIAIAINNTKSKQKMKELLDKTLIQAEELQVQQEELRQNNEELENQADILRQSELNLQTQKEELRVSNEELEDKTRKLEIQKEDIINSNEKLKKAKVELEDKAKELELANKYKSEFLANMSHELRTPLNSILVLSQLLQSKKDDVILSSKQLEYAKTIHSSGENLLRLINDILDLSKVEAGKIDINFEKVKLKELIDDTNKLFAPIALQRNLNFEIQIQDKLPEFIISDELRLKQIINNLLSNAFKFTHAGGVTINIHRIKESDVKRFELKDNINNLLAIEIIDTGIGISKDKQKLVFETFKQSDGTTSRKYGGTGLGLSISKDLIKLLGGAIYLESQENKGSKFTVIVLDNKDKLGEENLYEYKNEVNEDEFSKNHLNENTEKINADKSILSAKLNKETKKLLIVDENAEDVETMCETLGNQDIKITSLENGEEALKLLKREKFDCMILDLKLIDMTAVNLLNKLKSEDNINIPVLIYTERNVTQEDEAELNKYVESIIIKGNSSLDRLINEARLFLNLESKIEVEDINNENFTYKKEDSLKNKKILIVDDDMRNVFVLTNTLEDKGMKVIVGSNGTKAIEKLHENKDIDLIIMDVMMPEMDGYTAMKKIKSDAKLSNIPIIAITAKAMKDDRQKCIEAGADDYLTKPIEINKLISLLRVWLYK